MTLSIIESAYQDLAGVLSSNQLVHVYPLYLCERLPNKRTRVVLRGATPAAAIFSGGDEGFPEALGPWIFGDNADAVRLLLDDAGNGTPMRGLQYDYTLSATIQGLFPEAKLTRDLLFSFERERWPSANANFSSAVVPLYRGCAHAELLTPKMKAALGGLAWIEPGSPVWGYREGNAVVAVAEALVRSQWSASIAQVITDEAFRGRGFAKALVRHVAETLLREGFDLVYLVNEDNEPSVRLARALGFSVEKVLGCLE